MNIVGAHLHTLPLRLRHTAPEDDCLEFTGIINLIDESDIY